ncbi:MAG TPA: hypothetical protein VFV82_01695 [Candidatus Binatia bacterium]|nr:hypothetical protein [Candidatus Binatia bacterium]
MKTPLPPSITIPTRVDTRIGTLKFSTASRTVLPSFCSVDLYA